MSSLSNRQAGTVGTLTVDAAFTDAVQSGASTLSRSLARSFRRVHRRLLSRQQQAVRSSVQGAAFEVLLLSRSPTNRPAFRTSGQWPERRSLVEC
jgi:hypothetical protein